jgi:hypothetical protein
MIKKILRDDRGSLSVLIMGLFITILATLLILSDVSSVYFAKRALTQATEAAAQRAVKNLDMDSYYKSKYNATQLLINFTDERERDPGIPIDCAKGGLDAASAIDEFSSGRARLLGKHIGEIRIDRISCDGFQMAIATTSTARLPFQLPFININEVEIHSVVGTFDERKITTNYYGINIG